MRTDLHPARPQEDKGLKCQQLQVQARHSPEYSDVFTWFSREPPRLVPLEYSLLRIMRNMMKQQLRDTPGQYCCVSSVQLSDGRPADQMVDRMGSTWEEILDDPDPPGSGFRRLKTRRPEQI